ncbi:hypothetical protein H7347_01955 [Corynebacterium sp. zg-331]|uniref:hypothetical protein n=1 Tax=unclassified Corynebacterium TaxID=2624378 RepID=UPI00128DF803|nr:MULTISPECIES: hypothetical protein [unclassified Corynebacterium]MBC3185351.1 hypothetical protein [Corynebacterium sp. zg-331]MPV51848.1 hypothetical protein [Corynebacterium sp. zg331]
MSLRFSSRAHLVLATGLAATLLGGCAVDDFFGPRPHAAVSSLAAGARADADRLATTDPPLAALRRKQAEIFDAEVARLCGTLPDGTTPSSCATGQDDPAEAPEHTGLEQILAAFDSLPEESRPLAAEQAIALAKATGTTDVESAARNADLAQDALSAEAAREVLRREHALAYGVGVARAFGAGNLDDLTASIHERIAALTTALEPTGNVPVAEAGYLITGVPSPTDAASAQAFVAAAIAQAVDSWTAAAAAAPGNGSGWLALAITGAAHAGRFQ